MGTWIIGGIRVGEGSWGIKFLYDELLIIKTLDCLARSLAVGVNQGNSVRILPTRSWSHNLGLETGAGEIKKQSAVAMAGTSRAHKEQLPLKEGVDDHRHHEVEGLLDKSKECAMEVYRGEETVTVDEEEDDDVLELDLEDKEVATKFMAIAVYSQKSYNPKVLFSDMLNA
jgi:hypothetical protein